MFQRMTEKVSVEYFMYNVVSCLSCNFGKTWREIVYRFTLYIFCIPYVLN